jgi:hypothetical protein
MMNRWVPLQVTQEPRPGRNDYEFNPQMVS